MFVLCILCALWGEFFPLLDLLYPLINDPHLINDLATRRSLPAAGRRRHQVFSALLKIVIPSAARALL